MKMEKILPIWQEQCQSKAADINGEAPCRPFQAFAHLGRPEYGQTNTRQINAICMLCSPHMKQPKDTPPEVQPLPSTHEQRVEAFKTWQEGGKAALGKLLRKNEKEYEAKKKALKDQAK
jgi:hypothetical protein